MGSAKGRTRRASSRTPGLVLLGALGTVPAMAHARPGDVAGRGRAFFDLEAAYWLGRIRGPTPAALTIHTQRAGIVGVPRIPFGGGMAYGLSERFVIGGRLDLAIEPNTVDGTRLVTVRGGFNPFVEIMFLRRREVRPFIMLRAGIGRSQTFSKHPSSLDADGERTVYPTAGVGLGTHVFLSEEVSFDAMLTLDQRWNFARPAAGSDTASSGGGQPHSWQLRDSTLSAAFVVGFSRWW